MEKFRLALGIVVALIHSAAYYEYYRQIKTRVSRPNIITWSLWVFMTVVNALNFQAMTQDSASSLQFVVGSVGCAAIWIWSWRYGVFVIPRDWKQWAVCALGVAAVVVGFHYRQHVAANRILFLALIVSFIPTWATVLRSPFSEHPDAWLYWTLAFLLNSLNILFRPDWNMDALLIPLAMALAHGVTGFLCSGSWKQKLLS